MEYELNQGTLSKLNKIVTEYSKNYFLVKNNYYAQISEMQDFLTDKVNICDLIDTQYSLIKELSQIVNYLFSELSFRRCIIERKEHILKDLNKVIINKFIDKIYKQEIQIAELQKEKNVLQKIKNNTITFPKVIQFDNHHNDRSKTPVLNYNKANKLNTHLHPPPHHNHGNTSIPKSLPVNIIVPKNSAAYNGAYSFFNSSIKNIERFINIKNVHITGENKNRLQSNKLPAQSRRCNSSSGNNNISNSANVLTAGRIPESKQKTGKSRNENFLNKTFGCGLGLSVTNKTNISNISMNASNISLASTMTLNKTFTRNLLPSKQATTLLNKSHELIKKYQKHQKRNKAKSAHAGSPL